MDHRIQAWIDRREFLRMTTVALEAEVEFFLKQAKEAPFPANVRPAVAADIVVGTVIWRTFADGSQCWEVVESKPFTCDYWQSYGTNNGERYFLKAAFVEVEDE